FAPAPADGRLYAVLQRSDGKILTVAGSPPPPNEDPVRAVLASRRPAQALLSGGAVLEHVLPLSQTSADVTSAELRRPREVVLRAGYDRAGAEAELKARWNESLRRFLWAALLSLGVGLAGAAALAGNFTRAIKKLMQGAQDVRSGHLSAKVMTRRSDELGELSAEFNEMSRRLAELEDLKESFIAKITHDLRSPLGAVIGHAELMTMGTRGTLTPKQAESVRIIIESCRDLAELIDNILEVTKLEAGKLEFSPRSNDLRSAVDGVFALLAPKASEYGVTLDASAVPPGVAVWMDEQALRRTLTNLLSNALKFTPKDGRVSVEWAQEPGGGDRVSVRDSGIGIPADKLHTLFTKFSQIAETIHKVRYAKGTGLGLVICKEIVEGHGGSIRAESPEGGGAVFSFTLSPKPVGGLSPPPRRS
ncbi:MAG: histidine kinase, partial [Elusimicrobia bacterium]